MPEILIEHTDRVVVLKEPSRAASALGSIGSWLLVLLVFLLPLFYLEAVPDALDLPKQLLLLGITTIAGVLWLIRVFITRTIIFRRSFLFFPILLFLAGAILAAAFSVDPYVSFFGGSLGEYTSAVSFLGFAFFVFLAAATEHDLAFARRSITALLISSAILHLVTFLRFFGVPMFGLPEGASWNPIGTVFTMSVFSSVTALLASGILLFDRGDHRVFLPGRTALGMKAVAWIAGLLSLVFLLLIDWWVAWTILLVGVLLLVLFVFVYASSFRNIAHLLLPILFLVTALLFLFIRTPIPMRAHFAIAPSYGQSWQIAKETVRERPIFGTGPSAYQTAFAKHRTADLNQSALWNFRFDRSVSYVLTLLPTYGLVGGLLWLVLIAIVLGVTIRSFARGSEQSPRLLAIALFFAWSGLVLGKVLYQSNMTLEFLFWFVTALLIISTKRTISAASFETSPRALIGASFGTVVFAVLMIVVLVMDVSRGAAWAAFGSAVQAGRSGDLDRARDEIVRAVNLDPRTDTFMRNLAQINLLYAGRSEDVAQLRDRLNSAVAAAGRATELSPSNVANWSMLGGVYSEMSGVVGGAADRSVEAYRRAMELEPKNPVYYVQSAKARIAGAGRALSQAGAGDAASRATAEEHLSEALLLLDTAIELKPDYGPAHYYTAVVFERQGRRQEALQKLEALAGAAPRDIGVLFQLGLLYLNNNDRDKAEQTFLRAVQLSPNFANARWFLASIFEARGDFERAAEEIEAVLALNPDNEAVRDRLDALRRGQRTAPPLSPLEEAEEGGIER